MTKSTSLFIESIFIKNSEPLNLKWHQDRVNNTFNHFFPNCKPFILKETIHNPSNELQKCRITYSNDIEKIEFEPFTPKQIKSLKIVRSNNFDYSFKYADRTKIETLSKNRGTCDDILISINGYLKDCSFANIVLFDGSNYYTPDPPLLYGTKRAQLIEKKAIKPIPIKENELNKFQEIHLINALADLNEYKVKTKNVF